MAPGDGCHGSVPEIAGSMKKLITPGEQAPEFELDDIQGRRVRLSDYLGHIVVLDFLRGFM